MGPSISFRNNLRKLRLAMRFTQEALAHDAGTSSSYVSAIENGKLSPTLAAMQRLADALDVKLAYLIADKLSVSILSEQEIEIGAVPARPTLKLPRQPKKTTGRPRKSGRERPA